jgi:hypothetical protein
MGWRGKRRSWRLKAEGKNLLFLKKKKQKDFYFLAALHFLVALPANAALHRLGMVGPARCRTC